MNNTPYKFIFDTETARSFATARELGYGASSSNIPLSVMGYEFQQLDPKTGSYKTLEKSVVNEGQISSTLKRLIGGRESQVTLAGHNLAFDIPIIEKYSAGIDLGKVHTQDPFAEIYQQSGKMVKLDELSDLAGGPAKTGSGADAPKLFAEGKLNQLNKYQMGDVEATSAVVGQRNIRYINKKGRLSSISNITRAPGVGPLSNKLGKLGGAKMNRGPRPGQRAIKYGNFVSTVLGKTPTSVKQKSTDIASSAYKYFKNQAATTGNREMAGLVEDLRTVMSGKVNTGGMGGAISEIGRRSNFWLSQAGGAQEAQRVGGQISKTIGSRKALMRGAEKVLLPMAKSPYGMAAAGIATGAVLATSAAVYAGTNLLIPNRMDYNPERGRVI